MNFVIRMVALTAFLAFVAAQMAAAYVGIVHGLGSGWAVAALFVALYWRFTLPITVGAFYGAMHVWGWHWSLALVFTLPGLVFMLPGAIPAMISLATERSTAKLTRATPICAEH